MVNTLLKGKPDAGNPHVRLGMLLLVTLAVAGACRADWRDGLLWSFSAKQGEADGTFDAAKFVDEVSADTATPFTLTFNYDDEAARPYFTNVTVRSGLSGKSFSRTCLYLPQPTAGTIGSDFCCKLANATVPKAKLASGEVTFFIRYSWEGKFVNMKNYGEQYAYNYPVYFIDHAYDYASGKGWFFSMKADSSSVAHPYVVRAKWVEYMENNCWLDSNTTAGSDWIDLALTLRNTDEGTEFTCYVCRAGGSAIEKRTKTISGSGTIPAPGNMDGKIFGLYGKTIRESDGKLSVPGNFRGTIATVKLWNRALTEAEIGDAFREVGPALVLDNETLTLTEDRTVGSVSMTGTCAINGPGTLVVNAPAGISVTNGTATLACPVRFDTVTSVSCVTVTVDATSKLVQTGVWSGPSAIRLVGAGSDYATHSFELRGTNTFTGALSFDRAKVYLYGGASVGTADAGTSWTVSKSSNGSRVCFMGGTFAESFSASGSNNYKGWWQAAVTGANTTNIFTGSVNFGDPVYFVAQSGSDVTFDGSFNGNNTCTPSAEDGAVITFSTNCSYSTVRFCPGGNGLIRIFSKRKGGYSTLSQYDVGKGATWRLYGTNLINGEVSRGGSVSGTLDLNGFDQNAGACRGGAATGVVTSGVDAVWTIDQSNYDNVTNNTAFAGRASLCKKGGKNLILGGVSTTAGPLQVEAGTVSFSLNGAWAGPVNVAADATLAFLGDRTLWEGAAITLADDATLALDGQILANEGLFVVNGKTLAAGKYTASDGFITGAGTLTVNAAMGDPLVVEEDMTINEDLLVPSVTFKGPYTISGTGSLTVLGDGIRIDDGTDNKHGYVIDVPLTLSGNIGGSGYLTLLKETHCLETMTVSNVNLIVCGTLNLAKNLTFVKNPNVNDYAELILSNAVIEAGSTTIMLATSDTYYPLRVLAGTTNVVTCGNFRGNTGNARYHFGDQSLTTFNCRLTSLGYYCPSGTGEVIYNGALNGWNLSFMDLKFHFAATGNNFAFDANAQPKYATKVSVGKSATLFLDVANAFSDRRSEIQLGTGLIQLAASQRVGPIIGSGTVSSAVGATWDFEQHTFTSDSPRIEGPTTNTVVFADSVNVRKSGAHDVWFVGCSTSTGELQVAVGTVGFAGAGAWRTCPAVRVSSGATFVLDGRDRIGRQTTAIYLESGATLKLPVHTAIRCAALYLDGERQERGRYAQDNRPAYFEGPGSLWVDREPGTVLFLR